jgi:hypothetical protein
MKVIDFLPSDFIIKQTIIIKDDDTMLKLISIKLKYFIDQCKDATIQQQCLKVVLMLTAVLKCI